MPDLTKLVLLELADGPEAIVIYTSEDQAVNDWAATIPALYIEAAVQGAHVLIGPFNLKSIRDGMIAALTRSSAS